MNLEQFKKQPILGILRGIDTDIIEPLVETIVSAGLKTVEITMNTLQAGKLIKQMQNKAKNRLTIGAGTVLTMDELRLALDCGATFIVLPMLVPEVVAYCVRRKIPVFPGAFSPQEIYNAWRAGAAMVKVFPAKFFGPEYFKELKGPFQDIELLACGGVTAENIALFFSCGASAVAFGASVFQQPWLKARKFPLIEQRIKALVEQLQKVTQLLN